MATFLAQPLDMISAPNFYAPIENGWVLTSPNQVVLWFQLQINDSLGLRPYFAAVGSLLQLTFQRQDLLTLSPTTSVLTQTQQSVIKTASPNTPNGSLWSTTLTSQDVQTIRSGTVLFSITESGTQTQWTQNWLITKNLTKPGF